MPTSIPGQVHSAITKLHALLFNLQGKDTALMTPTVVNNLQESVTKGFIDATAGLHNLLLGEQANDPRWLWMVEKAQSFGGEWMSTYTMLDAGRMELAIGKPEKVQIAAALFPDLCLTVDIFSAYHHPGGTGLQVDPRISITLALSGDPELALVERYLKLFREFYPQPGKGISVEIAPRECDVDFVQNPVEINEAFALFATAVRKAAKRDASSNESIRFVLSVDSSVDLERMQDAFEYMGKMFTTVIEARK